MGGDGEIEHPQALGGRIELQLADGDRSELGESGGRNVTH
jgi:hypothetical protein